MALLLLSVVRATLSSALLAVSIARSPQSAPPAVACTNTEVVVIVRPSAAKLTL